MQCLCSIYAGTLFFFFNKHLIYLVFSFTWWWHARKNIFHCGHWARRHYGSMKKTTFLCFNLLSRFLKEFRLTAVTIFGHLHLVNSISLQSFSFSECPLVLKSITLSNQSSHLIPDNIWHKRNTSIMSALLLLSSNDHKFKSLSRTVYDLTSVSILVTVIYCF